MKKRKKNNCSKYLRYIAKIILISFAVLIFIFSLLSGAEQYGGGIKGVLMNSPNALPWLVLLVFVFISLKYELTGGILIVLMGFFSLLFFKTYEDLVVFFIISFPLLLLGSFFIINWWFKRKNV